MPRSRVDDALVVLGWLALPLFVASAVMLATRHGVAWLIPFSLAGVLIAFQLGRIR